MVIRVETLDHIPTQGRLNELPEITSDISIDDFKNCSWRPKESEWVLDYYAR